MGPGGHSSILAGQQSGPHRGGDTTKGELSLLGELLCLTLCSHRHHVFCRGWSFSAVPLDMIASLVRLSLSLSLSRRSVGRIGATRVLLVRPLYPF